MVSTLPGADVHPPAQEPSVAPQPNRTRRPVAQLAAATWGVPAIAATASALYLGISYFLPLQHTDLWGHLSYGRYLSGRGVFPLPDAEPLMPLATGVRFVDTAWLSQLLGYWTHQVAGLAGLKFLFAGAIALCAVLLMWRIFQRTGKADLALFGAGLFLWVDWKQLEVVRPQLAGLVLFLLTFVLLTARRWSPANWVFVPLIFALWANLHGSFPTGLMLIAAFCAGRVIDIARRAPSPSLRLVFADRQVRRYFVLLELAALATLVNPYGLGLYAEVLSIATHPNLMDLVEWEPLTLRMWQGKAAAFAAVTLIFAYRLSPRRVRAVEVLLLLGLGLAALWTSRMIVWWAPVATYYLMLHGNAIWDRDSTSVSKRESRSVLASLLAVAVVAVALLISPIGLYLLQGREPNLRSSVSANTPVGAVEYLQQNPPSGLIFNTYEWGDYLLWAGPPNAQVFVASHAHLVPRLVWQHYLQVIELRAEWDEVLDHYGVNTILVDKPLRRAMIIRLQRNDAWETAYEDERAVVFTRREPLR